MNNDKCSVCGAIHYVVKSNNPLVSNLCETCIEKTIDKANVSYFAFFCRTFNLYFNAELYMRMYKSNKEHLFTAYVKQLAIEEQKEFDDGTVGDNWKKVQEEWGKILRYEELYARLDPIKDGFLKRAQIKWGTEFTFSEYIQLESLFMNTIKTYNLTDPMRIDAVKKACKSSIIIDRELTGGESKNIKDYISAYQMLLKIAKIEELGEMASETQIKTVSDLYKYLEKNGFTFTFYDNEDRDIVDRTIRDIKESIREELVNATGLDQLLEQIKVQYTKNLEVSSDELAYSQLPLERLMDDEYDEIENEADKKFAAQDIDTDIEYDEEDF